MKKLTALISVPLLVLAALGTAAGPAQAGAEGGSGRVVYSRYDPATGEPRIFVADATGRHERQLALPTPSDNPVWAPDRNKILLFAFPLDSAARPATVDSDGSDFKVLKVSALPLDVDIRCTAWSPHGDRLLCQVSRFGGDPALNGIYTIRASDGGGLRRLTVNPYPPSGNFGGGDIPGDFSPDGKQFVFMRAKPGPEPTPDIGQSGALFVGRSDGSQVRQITPYGVPNSHDNGLAHWSPDASQILFASEQGQLLVIRPDGTHQKRINLRTDTDAFAFSPGWSPDGKRIIFSLFLQGTQQEDIYTASTKGTQLAQLTNTPESEDFADWSGRADR